MCVCVYVCMYLYVVLRMGQSACRCTRRQGPRPDARLEVEILYVYMYVCMYLYVVLRMSRSSCPCTRQQGPRPDACIYAHTHTHTHTHIHTLTSSKASFISTALYTAEAISWHVHRSVCTRSVRFLTLSITRISQ